MIPKINKAMEIFWLVIVIISSLYIAYEYIVNGGYDGDRILLFIPFIALLLFFFRRGLRKRMENAQNQMDE